ncbi:hypothetical protein DH2020_026948 [Rehmannia glutinosa]|uniref:BHLH domain-containing protein n=1 Tax=Rehmannia glutinosa TaxID=99300 RepID=A0ABR0VVH3_REHGL
MPKGTFITLIGIRVSKNHRERKKSFESTKNVTMSSRRSRSRQSPGASRISDDQIADLVSRLQQLIPEMRNRRSDKVSASKVLQETCNYIRSLHREVDDLSDRLSELLESTDSDSAQAAIIRSLLM